MLTIQTIINIPQNGFLKNSIILTLNLKKIVILLFELILKLMLTL